MNYKSVPARLLSRLGGVAASGSGGAASSSDESAPLAACATRLAARATLPEPPRIGPPAAPRKRAAEPKVPAGRCEDGFSTRAAGRSAGCSKRGGKEAGGGAQGVKSTSRTRSERSKTKRNVAAPRAAAGGEGVHAFVPDPDGFDAPRTPHEPFLGASERFFGAIAPAGSGDHGSTNERWAQAWGTREQRR